MEHCNAEFAATIASRDFESYDDFMSTLLAFQEKWSIPFYRRNTVKDRYDPRLKYIRLAFYCAFNGRTRESNTGTKRAYPLTECPSRICVQKKNGRLLVSSYKLQCNHDRNSDIYLNSVCKPLMADEKLIVIEMLKSAATTTNIQNVVLQRFHKHVNVQAIADLRMKLEKQNNDVDTHPTMPYIPALEDVPNLLIPPYRTRMMMKSSPDVETVSVDAFVYLSRATELFIKELVSGAVDHGVNECNYEDLAKLRERTPRYVFLADVLPSKITVREWMAKYKDAFEASCK